jgi:hypothetical protein
MHTVSYNLPPIGLQWILRIFSPRRFKGTLKLPSMWTEMTDAQVMEVAHHLFAEHRNPMVPRIAVLRSLLAIPDHVFKRLAPVQVNDLRRLVEWIWTTPLTGCVHSFKFNRRRWYFPRSIGQMSGAEYAAAESLVRGLLTPGEMDPSKLDELVATLCRLQGERYDSAQTELRAVAFSKLNPRIKLALFKWYLDNLSRHQAKYKLLWEGGGEEASTPAAKALMGFGFYKVLMDLAETQVFGDWEKTNYTTVTTIFTYLVNKRLQAIETERIMREKERSRGNGSH